MSPPEVIVHPDAAHLARAAAARLITRIVDAQWSRGSASIVLTGGGSGIGVLEQVAASPVLDAVDWRRVHIWWGDERFVAAEDSDRNDLQARVALLGHLDLDPDLVHPFPALGGPHGDDADAAAAWYAEELASHVGADPAETAFDVLMLGLGEEGHCASIFPQSPAARDQRAVCAVYDCPKPPPTRVSMTFPTLARSAEVWFMTTGAGKADAVAAAVGGADPLDVPCAGPRGRDRTLWLLDTTAASRLPQDRTRLP